MQSAVLPCITTWWYIRVNRWCKEDDRMVVFGAELLEVAVTWFSVWFNNSMMTILNSFNCLKNCHCLERIYHCHWDHITTHSQFIPSKTLEHKHINPFLKVFKNGNIRISFHVVHYMKHTTPHCRCHIYIYLFLISFPPFSTLSIIMCHPVAIQ